MMSRLIIDRKLSCLHTKDILLMHPPGRPANPSVEDYLSLSVQGFIWYSNAIIFHSNNGFLWLTAYEAKEANVQKDAQTAIVVPVKIPAEGYICVEEDLDSSCIKLSMPPGHYSMLFELREMKNEEFSIEKYVKAYPHVAEPDFVIRPEICTLTFVPARKRVEPQLLKFKPSIPYQYKKQVRLGEMSADDFLPDEFVLHNTPIETGW